MALVVTIIILLILASVSITTIFGDNGIIRKAQIAKNETEVNNIREALKLYYLQQYVATTNENPVAEQFPRENITDQTTLETIVEYQSDAENIDQIHFDRLYKLDVGRLGLYNIENEYFMDIETRMVFINNGIEISSGMIYIIEEMEIYPVSLEVQEGEEGFILVAKADEENRQINSYDFYIDNELYKTVVTTQNSAEIEVRNKEFGEYQCYVRVNRSNGQNDKSIEVTAENYYVKNKADMEIFRERVNRGNNFAGKTIRLVNNIDLEGSETNRNWIPIGNETTAFSGTLEGNNCEITNIYNQSTTSDYQGLFGIIDGGNVLNLNIVSGNIEGREKIGGIVGKIKNGEINKAENSADVHAENGFAGGIIGDTEVNAKITNCINRGEISANGYTEEYSQSRDTCLGGIAGRLYGEITNCTNYGNINSNYSSIGGLVGTLFNSTGSNLTNEGKVQATLSNANSDSTCGGIIGYCYESTLDNCANKAQVIAQGSSVGGIAGIQINGSIANSSNNAEVTTERAVVGGIIGYSSTTNINTEELSIKNCYNTGTIQALGSITGADGNTNSLAGGIIGSNGGTKILASFNTGKVTIQTACGGGITGSTENNGSIVECYNYGTITSFDKNEANDCCIGGISGWVDNGTIEYCYNRGEIIGSYNGVSGIIGKLNTGNLRNSYNAFRLSSNNSQLTSNYLGQISNCYYLGDVTSNESRTEADMKTSVFINLIGGSSIWKLDNSNVNNGFVIFQWQ